MKRLLKLPSFALLLLLLFAVSACGTAAASRERPVPIQPGAPGEPSQPARPRPVPALSPSAYTEADVEFMQGMIAHHAQALEMAALVPERTDDADLELLAERVVISQNTEIAAMQNWLAERGETVPQVGEHAGHPGMAGSARMPGMLTPQEMTDLAAARGPEFRRLFLRRMIQHHLGALTMVETLFATPGGGQEGEIFQIAEGIAGDQRIEIARMSRMLVS